MSAAYGIVRVDVLRGGHVESRHDVDFAIAEAGDEMPGDQSEPVFLRSSAKPFQAAAVIAGGAADRFGFTEEEVAIVAASHSGEDRHTAIVSSLLTKLGVSVSALGCGIHPPLDVATAARHARFGGGLSALHHNCSGKHAGMIALALQLGEPAGRYLDPEGAVQSAMRHAVALACGLLPSEVVTAIDGCSALTFAVTLAAAARAFAQLARPEVAPPELRAPLGRVAAAMAAHPELIGGSGRFDTHLMESAGGRLLSKAGAEGVQGVVDRTTGRGLCLKVRDGGARAVAPATLEVMRHLGWIDAAMPETLRDEWRPPIVNFAGKRVGETIATIVRTP